MNENKYSIYNSLEDYKKFLFSIVENSEIKIPRHTNSRKFKYELFLEIEKFLKTFNRYKQANYSPDKVAKNLKNHLRISLNIYVRKKTNNWFRGRRVKNGYIPKPRILPIITPTPIVTIPAPEVIIPNNPNKPETIEREDDKGSEKSLGLIIKIDRNRNRIAKEVNYSKQNRAYKKH